MYSNLTPIDELNHLRTTKAWLSERLLNPMFYTKAELDEWLALDYYVSIRLINLHNLMKEQHSTTQSY